MNLYRNQKICLKELYWDKKLSTSEIAKVYNCNSETIRRLMIRHNIPRRPIHERKYKISKEMLNKLYNKNKLSTIEIAKKFGCSQWVIWSLLQYYDIGARDANDYHAWKSPANQIKPILSPSPILSYVTGVILGDGWVYKINHSYSIGLETLDKPFCESLVRALQQIKLNPCLMFNKNRFWRVTATSKLFYEWYKSLKFKDIEKIAIEYPKEFVRGFYESEGCLSIYKSRKYRYTNCKIIICNTKEELINLTKELLKILGFHPTIRKKNNPLPRKPLWILVLGRKAEVKQFLDIVKPCIKTGEKRLSRNL